MARKRFSVEQIVAVLKQAEMGLPVTELVRDLATLLLRQDRDVLFLGRSRVPCRQSLFK